MESVVTSEEIREDGEKDYREMTPGERAEVS